MGTVPRARRLLAAVNLMAVCMHLPVCMWMHHNAPMSTIPMTNEAMAMPAAGPVPKPSTVERGDEPGMY